MKQSRYNEAKDIVSSRLKKELKLDVTENLVDYAQNPIGTFHTLVWNPDKGLYGDHDRVEIKDPYSVEFWNSIDIEGVTSDRLEAAIAAELDTKLADVSGTSSSGRLGTGRA